MTEEEQLRRFRNVLEASPNLMLRGAALGISLAIGVADVPEVVEYLDEFTRIWRELRLEAKLT